MRYIRLELNLDIAKSDLTPEVVQQIIDKVLTSHLPMYIIKQKTNILSVQG